MITVTQIKQLASRQLSIPQALLRALLQALLRSCGTIRASIHKDPAARVLRDLVQGSFAPPKPP